MRKNELRLVLTDALRGRGGYGVAARHFRMMRHGPYAQRKRGKTSPEARLKDRKYIL